MKQAPDTPAAPSLPPTYLTALYFRVMNIDPARPDWPDRDRFILSKGHACPVWYCALAERGYFDKSHMHTLRRLNSILQGHPDMHKTPGIDMTAGSLGHGICAGLGMALAGRLQRRPYRVWVVIGDGEMQEGSVWEAAMAAAGKKVDNFTVILDRNRIQNDDFVDNVMPVGAVAEKWQAFGWHVIEIDGHNMAQIVDCAGILAPRHRPAGDDRRPHHQRSRASASWRTTRPGTAVRPTKRKRNRRCTRSLQPPAWRCAMPPSSRYRYLRPEVLPLLADGSSVRSGTDESHPLRLCRGYHRGWTPESGRCPAECRRGQVDGHE